MYSGTAQPAAIASYNIKFAQFEHRQRVRAGLHSAISRSLGTVTLQSINSKHHFGTGSLSPLDLVRELKIMFGTIIKHEIDATQEAILTPLVHFTNCWDFSSSITQNYEFLSSAGRNIPELTCIDNFLSVVQAWSQFNTYISTWRANTPLGQRTLASLQKHLLDQYGDMPHLTSPLLTVKMPFPPTVKDAVSEKARGKPTKAKDVVKATNVPTTSATTTLNPATSLFCRLDLELHALPALTTFGLLEFPLTPLLSSRLHSPRTSTLTSPTYTASSMVGISRTKAFYARNTRYAGESDK
jgi:hypothetical protein